MRYSNLIMKQKNICYYCGVEATTKEHLPPRQMFKGFNCDSITVPSCEEHNCKKGGKDQAITSALLMPFNIKIMRNKSKDLSSNPELVKAVLSAKSSFERTKHRALSKDFIENYPKELGEQPEVGFIINRMKIKNWINNLTAGLVFDCTKTYKEEINWDTVDNWSPNYIPRSTQLKLQEAIEILRLNEELKNWLESNIWEKGWSAYPKKYPEKIYLFFIAFNGKEIIFKHVFYNSYSWYVWFSPSTFTRKLLLSKINA